MASGKNLFHLHIPKTAGTSLRAAFENGGYKVEPIGPRFAYDSVRDAGTDLFSGHVGYRALADSPALRDRVVTLLRDPYDRAASYFFHLVQLHDEGVEVSDRTIAAAKYGMLDFFGLKDHPHILTDLYNSLTWSVVYDSNIEERRKFRSASPRLSDADLVRRAKDNLESFLVVGLQARMGDFARRLEAASGFASPIGTDLVNAARPPLDAIDASVKRRMRDWLELDIELYRWASSRFGG